MDLTPLSRIMTEPVVTIDIHRPLSEARHLFNQHPFTHLPVVRGNALVGILSRSDVDRLSLERMLKDDALIEAYLDQLGGLTGAMTFEPVVLSPHDTFHQAAEILAEGSFHALPVVSASGELVGLITSTDLLRHVFKPSPPPV